MIVPWIETAIKHLTTIYHSMAQDAPLYTQPIADKLIRRTGPLAAFPPSGRRVSEYQDPEFANS